MYLEVKDLAKYYHKGNPIIKKLNFSVEKGEVISFIGESGSGKTTFLKCLAGLEDINSGTIILNNNIINDDNIFIKPQNRKIGYVFQDYPLFPHLNILENIKFNLNKKYEIHLKKIISLTGLEELLNRYPHEVSGGEQQRACIARSIVREPDLLLLDEPFSNLDTNIKFIIRDEIYRIIKKLNITTILVTHDINDVLNISDKILIFKAGILQQYSTPETMYCNPANCYCAEILGDINKLSFKGNDYYIRPENLKVVKESNYSFVVEKCFFQGKDYRLIGNYNGNIWSLISDDPIKLNNSVFFEFQEEDLIYFDKKCSNFFIE